MMHRILRSPRRRSLRVLPIVAIVIGAIILHDIAATMLYYGAIVGIAISGIALIVGGRRGKSWCSKLLIYSVGVALLAYLLAQL